MLKKNLYTEKKKNKIENVKCHRRRKIVNDKENESARMDRINVW